jgi:hypothetical protein
MDDQENESQQHPTEPLHIQSSAERRDRDILRTERSQLAKLAQVLKLADFMAILMVLATFFSAYATWRTAMLTSTIFAVSDRPFLGAQQVTFEATGTQHPTILVNYRNFGSIPALDTIVAVHAVVDGKLVQPAPDAMSAIDAGILSPNVPHYFYVSVPPDKYQAVAAGKSNLQVHVRLLYKGPAHEKQLCYFERFAYHFGLGVFQASGGDDRCGTDVF